MILGIDGGGTKTDMVLADNQGNVLTSVRVGQSNLHSTSAKQIQTELKNGLSVLFKQAKLSKRTKLTAVSAGLSGLDSQEDINNAKNIFHQVLKDNLTDNRHLMMVNDTVIGFWSGSTSKQGLCVIGGTGSNCYGRTKHGKEARSGGLGSILSDQGSGYDIGMNALKAVTKSYDGRGEKSLLEPMLLQYFKVKKFPELVKKLYYQPFNKNDFAKLALIVQRAAENGDKVARRISLDAVDELVLMVKAVAHKLAFKKQTFDLVMIGGVLQKDPLIKRSFRRQVKQLFPRVKFIIPRVDPVIGAINLALSRKR